MRERVYINNDWDFLYDFDDGMLQSDYVDKNLQKVRIPHTVTETPFDYFDESVYQTICGYRKVIYAPKQWESKDIVLHFEGVAHTCEVYLNGIKLAEHRCGYTGFDVNLSDELKFESDNVITVKVNSNEQQNIPPFGFVVDYMTYGGIYREVYLEVLEKAHMQNVFCYGENIVVTDRLHASNATLTTEYSLTGIQSGMSIRQVILEGKNIVASVEEKLKAGQTKITLHNIVTGIALWSPEQPALYNIKNELLSDGSVVDDTALAFGFRTAEFKADGFYLNHEKYKIRGLNRHQSYPYVGYAMPKSMQELDAKLLKNELGLNAVRTSHYPQSHHFVSRCDELGLLVFTEIPGWQHIGDEAWKNQAVENTREMVLEYRNHTSIVLWGVRINESPDDDEFYKRTNEVAHGLDPTRSTGGVRCIKNSHLFEDVYTYNDFVHSGNNIGCEPKNKVTSDKSKAYLISEYNGHMFSTKNFDCEEHMREHALRHANVLNSVMQNKDIAGSFGWCMFDYNTHKDFGSGDRICYHGVMDMFRNGKQASHIYACQQNEIPVLELSSSMDIGEHPGCNRGFTWIYTNADSVRMYKNDRFIKEYFPKESPYKYMEHGPILLDDFIGDAISENENFKPGQAAAVKEILNAYAMYGTKLPAKIMMIAAKLVLVYHMNPGDAVGLYNKYIGDWGGTATVYRFEAIKNDRVVKTLVKEPVKNVMLSCEADHYRLTEDNTYDVAEIRIRAVDQNGNTATFFQEPIELSTEGPIELIGPRVISLKGGMTGTYVRTIGETGIGRIYLKNPQMNETVLEFEVKESEEM